jgi:hypothetical protein
LSKRPGDEEALKATLWRLVNLEPRRLLAGRRKQVAVDLHGVDQRLLDFAERNGLKITSGREGKHNVHSKHYLGKAIDFRSRGLKEPYVAHLRRDAVQHSLTLRDERNRPPGQQVWGGPHFHLEVD